MPRYTYLLFDLDGTLTDSEEGVVKSFQHGLRAFGIEENNPALLRRVIGPPLLSSYRDYYGLDAQQAMRAVKVFQERYETVGKFENRPYPGMADLLCALNKAGYQLIVATSKPEYFARQILDHFALTQYFAYIFGADEDIGRTEKADVIREAMRVCPQLDCNNTVMIGDRKYDVLGAWEWGLDCIGVLYGFGDRAELEAAGARAIVASVAELEALLLH